MITKYNMTPIVPPVLYYASAAFDDDRHLDKHEKYGFQFILPKFRAFIGWRVGGGGHWWFFIHSRVHDKRCLLMYILGVELCAIIGG